MNRPVLRQRTFENLIFRKKVQICSSQWQPDIDEIQTADTRCDL